MKKIEVTIRPFESVNLTKDLVGAGLVFTVEEAKGWQKGVALQEAYKGSEYAVEYMPRCKVTVIVDDGDVERVKGVITKSLKDNPKSLKDAEAFMTVSEIEQAWSIKTKQRLSSIREGRT